jgi:tetratricopeptide (TPR) repeat protein
LALQGASEAAVESARHAVRLNPLSAEAWANLSAGMLTRGRWDDAEDAAERTVELAPGWSNARFSLGMVYFYRKAYAEAVEQLDGLSVAWTGAGAEMLRARALVRLGRVDEARALIPDLEAKGDEYALAALEAELGNPEAAYERLMAMDRWDDWSTLAIRNLDRPLWAPDGEDDRYEEVLVRVDASWGIERR